MTTEENKPQISPEQLQVIRQALTETIFKSYHELIKKLQQLPINHGLPLIQKAYLEIDCSMLVFKEMLTSCPLFFTTVPPKETQEKKEETDKKEINEPTDQNENKENPQKEKNTENEEVS